MSVESRLGGMLLVPAICPLALLALNSDPRTWSRAARSEADEQPPGVATNDRTPRCAMDCDDGARSTGKGRGADRRGGSGTGCAARRAVMENAAAVRWRVGTVIPDTW
jgi:hypothetical protein